MSSIMSALDNESITSLEDFLRRSDRDISIVKEGQSEAIKSSAPLLNLGTTYDDPFGHSYSSGQPSATQLPPSLPTIDNMSYMDASSSARTPPVHHRKTSSSRRSEAVSATPKRSKLMSDSPLLSPAMTPSYTASEGPETPAPDSFVGAKRVQWVVNDSETWHRVFDHQMGEIPQPGFRVEIDKGVKRSATDDSFICQKKNHFQTTVAVKMQAQPAYVATRNGLLKVSAMYVSMYGIKTEQPNKRVGLEQSQSDRSKKPFDPVPMAILANEVTKVTVGRLHFAETTANNMRKKGKPNPDQRYFALVVTLAAKSGDEFYTVASHKSENLIVRASNPGQFETEPSIHWVKGRTVSSVFHNGAVGINTDTPDEALCVRGNIRLSGAILQPSDRRIKTNLQLSDCNQHLNNIKTLNMYEYQLKRPYAKRNKDDANRLHLGVIAQEVQSVMPDAVRYADGEKVESVDLEHGDRNDAMMVIDRERLFMESLGAVKQLASLTDVLLRRVSTLESTVQALQCQQSPQMLAKAAMTFDPRGTEFKAVTLFDASGSFMARKWLLYQNSVVELGYLVKTSMTA